MANYEWSSRPRNYERERKQTALASEPTFEHPLKLITVSEVKVKKSTKSSIKSKSTPLAKKPSISADPLSSALDGTDPLSQLAASSVIDPLSRAAASGSIVKPGRKDSTDSVKSRSDSLGDTFESWNSKKVNILTKYTTSEKLSITTSFLSQSDREKVVMKSQIAQGTVTDKVKNRLEQLDDFEEGSVKEMLNLSQQDYVNRINELNDALITSWEQDQKVKALKIAIQCSKLLADTSVIQFYPSKFVLITDILDTFGKLVYDRIRRKSTYQPSGSSIPQMLPEKFTPDQVPDSAKETCRNWFFKIASIRELIPRLYVEVAIMKCYGFLTTGEYSQALLRLTNQMRGIGDPLVAIYARGYLCRVGVAVAPDVKDHLINNFFDFLSTYTQLQKDSVQNILAIQRLEMVNYLSLYSPALDWILQCIAHKASEETLTEILAKCKKQCNSALLLNSIMSAFKPEFISKRALGFTELIKECEEAGFPKHHLYSSLGTNLVLADPPEDQRLTVLNEVWKVVMKQKVPKEYINCAEVWVEYPCKHFTKREVNTILGDIIKHMTPNRAFEDSYQQLQSVMSKVLAHMHDFSILFAMDKFLPFLDMFQKESVKVEVCKNIMEAFAKHQKEPTNDPVILNALMFICRTMHDSVTALTLEDERSEISHLISCFIRKVSFGRDFEQQLSFYVETRAYFSNLDDMLVTLVQCVNQLAMETRAVVQGKHSRKTAAFVRACAAYCFITIPSILNVFHRLNLYLVSGQVAFLNQALTQGDAFLKAAISIIPEVPRVITIDRKTRSTEGLLISYIQQFLSTLLIVPDHPDQVCLYLVRGLLNILQDYTWEQGSPAKIQVYMSVLCLLTAQSQEMYAYHIPNVDSNDSLYGSDKKFLAEVNGICNTILGETLDYLKTLNQSETGLKRQAAAALDLFHHIVVFGDITKQPVATLATNLWNLAKKHGHGDTKLMVRLLDYLKRKGAESNGKAYKEIVSKLSLQTRT